MSYLEKITDIYTQLGKGKAMEAFEAYYHNDCDMVLEDGTIVAGKDANRDREIEFFSNVESFNGMEIKAINSNEETATTSVECSMDVTFKGGNQMVIEQVATQKWDGDHIIRERFYSNSR